MRLFLNDHGKQIPIQITSNSNERMYFPRLTHKTYSKSKQSILPLTFDFLFLYAPGP